MARYKLFIDESLDHKFRERLEKQESFGSSKKWSLTHNLKDADAYLVTEGSLEKSSSFKDQVSIEPIICVNPKSQPSEFKVNDLDGDEVFNILKEIEPIVDRIHHLEHNDILEEGDPFLMGLAFIWSRGKILKPIIDRRLERGVWYPYFDTHVFDGSAGSETLAFLKNSGFLSSHIHEVAHSCPKCASIVVLLRDGCIDCGSVDVVEENLVHHFACGYQAAESRFLVQNEELLSELWCPKCHKPLRHYGTDYDKPSIMYRCRRCQHENSETRICGKCLSCQADFPGEESPRREIKDYELTNLGLKALFEKEVNLFNLRQFMGQYIDVVPFDSFVMLSQKLSNIRSDLKISILKLSLKHNKGGEVDDEILSDARIMLDIGKSIARHIRKSDSVSIYRGTLYILFVEAGGISEQRLMDKEGIRNLLDASLAKRIVTTQMSLQEFLKGYLGRAPLSLGLEDRTSDIGGSDEKAKMPKKKVVSPKVVQAEKKLDKKRIIEKAVKNEALEPKATSQKSTEIKKVETKKGEKSPAKKVAKPTPKPKKAPVKPVQPKNKEKTTVKEEIGHTSQGVVKDVKGIMDKFFGEVNPNKDKDK